jgi:pyruvate dehydrogenase E1 component alpha subunit
MNWSKADEEKITTECEQKATTAIEHYLATGPRPPETMFDHLYARLPNAYIGQRKEIEDLNA